MTEARPLREVFADLADSPGPPSTDPAELLAAHGHPDLPAELVAEAVVSYADTVPPEVAEHLAPYVMAHGPIPTGEVADTPWTELLATAPEPELSELDSPDVTDVVDADPADGLDFGAGATPEAIGEHVEAADLPDDTVTEHHAGPAGDLGWEPATDEDAGAEQQVDIPDEGDIDDDLFE
jgi:hypothetical protein